MGSSSHSHRRLLDLKNLLRVELQGLDEMDWPYRGSYFPLVEKGERRLVSVRVSAAKGRDKKTDWFMRSLM